MRMGEARCSSVLLLRFCVRGSLTGRAVDYAGNASYRLPRFSFVPVNSFSTICHYQGPQSTRPACFTLCARFSSMHDTFSLYYTRFIPS